MTCNKCGVDCVEVDNPTRVEMRPRRGLEGQCKGGEGCLCGWPEPVDSDKVRQFWESPEGRQALAEGWDHS